MPELIQVMQVFDANADEVTAVPKFTYGDNPRSGAAATMGGLSMLMAQANIALKDFVVSWDEGVTKPFHHGPVSLEHAFQQRRHHQGWLRRCSQGS